MRLGGLCWLAGEHGRHRGYGCIKGPIEKYWRMLDKVVLCTGNSQWNFYAICYAKNIFTYKRQEQRMFSRDY